MGCYLVAARFASRRLGVGLAVAVLVFFAALALGLDWMVRQAGLR